MKKPADISAWGVSPPRWIQLLAAAVDAADRTRVGARIGMSRATVGLCLMNRYPSPSTAAVERRVLAAFDTIDCPVLGQIPGIECQSHRDNPNRNNPTKVQLCRTCPRCPNNPEVRS